MERFNDKYKIWQPMKYATAKKEELLEAALDDPNYGLQLKIDGASYVWAKDLDGSVHLYGDKISKKTGEIIDKIDNVPHMKEFAEQYFPDGTQFVVEVSYNYDWSSGKPQHQPRSNSKFVNSIMLSGPEKAIARQNETVKVCAYIFDCLYMNGEPIYKKDFADRYKVITNFWDELPMIAGWLDYAYLVTDEKRGLLASWMATGEEGGVLKLLHSTNKISAAHAVTEIGETAKRPMHTTYKIKQMDTIDAVCIGVCYPDKEYKGKNPETYQYRDEEGNPVNRLWALHMIDAIEIGLWDNDTQQFVKIGTVASGLDDEMRRTGFEDPNSLINHVFELTCMSVDKVSKTLRHPRLMYEREDKAPEQCLMSEVFA